MSKSFQAMVADQRRLQKRLLAELKTPRELAKYFIRNEILRGLDLEDLQKADFSSGNYFWRVSSGFFCGAVKPGKLKVKIKGQEAETFSLIEIYKEVKSSM